MANRDDITTARNTVTIGMPARTIVVEPIDEGTVGKGSSGMVSKEGIANSPVAADGIAVMAATRIEDMGTVDMGAESMPSIAAGAAVATLADSLTIAAAGIIMLIAATDRIVRGTAERGGVTEHGVASTLQRDPIIGAAVTIVVSLLGADRTTDRIIFHTDTMARTRADPSSSQDDTPEDGTPAVGATGTQHALRITVNDRTTAVIIRIMRSFALSADIRITGDITSLPTIATTIIRVATRKVSRRQMKKEVANHRKTGRKPSRRTSLRLTRQRALVAAAAVQVGSRCAKLC